MFKEYAKYYDKIYKDKPYKKEIEFVYNWANKPKSILDLGCGTASYWKYYPKETLMLGIEQSKEMKKQSKYAYKIALADFTKLNMKSYFKNIDCVTALFDVVNYTKSLNWIKKLPLKKDGVFIFDMWEYDKVIEDGFSFKKTNGRTIYGEREGREVNMYISINGVAEEHKMYLHSREDLINACGNKFLIESVGPTKTWQTWYKLRKI